MSESAENSEEGAEQAFLDLYEDLASLSNESLDVVIDMLNILTAEALLVGPEAAHRRLMLFYGYVKGVQRGLHNQPFLSQETKDAMTEHKRQLQKPSEEKDTTARGTYL